MWLPEAPCVARIGRAFKRPLQKSAGRQVQLSMDGIGIRLRCWTRTGLYFPGDVMPRILLCRTQVVDYRCRIEIEGVTVMSGDLIFGDVDGVLVIPAEHIEYVIEKALEKARGEKNVRKAIEKGMSATEAFATFGIL